jgi:RsiW-degrading membrane proteinase PrsW (M82 family)
MWAAIREILHCDWNPAGAGEFLAIAQGLSGRYRRLVWFAFAAQCWALWNVRNKMIFDGSLISNPSDVLYKMLIYMQQWRMLVKSTDRSLLDAAMEEIKRLHSSLREQAQA